MKNLTLVTALVFLCLSLPSFASDGLDGFAFTRKAYDILEKGKVLHSQQEAPNRYFLLMMHKRKLWNCYINEETLLCRKLPSDEENNQLT